MALIVQKFGGSSVADDQKRRTMAQRIIEAKKQGNQVVVVLSAPGKMTDDLVKLAEKACINAPDKREYDVLLATGEQISIALMAMILKSKGLNAISLTGAQAQINTCDNFNNARIRSIDKKTILKHLKNNRVVIVAGFQGCDQNGNITTLGRGGSDTSAVAIAAALNADVCEIYTDVDGVYTTDPNICGQARKIQRLTYEEMLEMSSLGAKVLQIRSVEFAQKYNVAIHVRNSQNRKEGTMIQKENGNMERLVVTGVISNTDESRITIKQVPNHPGIANAVFGPLADKKIIVDMIVQNVGPEVTDISFTVPKNAFELAYAITQKTAEKIQAKAVANAQDVAKISVVGVGMKNHSGVAALMFKTLAENNINIHLISTSEIRISCLIDAKYTELAVQTLHSAFELDKISESSLDKTKFCVIH